MDFETAVDQSCQIVAHSSRAWRPRVPGPAAAMMVAAGEGVLVFGASLLGWMLFQVGSGRMASFDAAVSVGTMASVLFLVGAWTAGLYRISALLVPPLRRVLLVCTSVCLLVTANLFVLKAGAEVSRGYLIIFAMVLLFTVSFARVFTGTLLSRLVAQRVISGRRAVIIGSPLELGRLNARDLFRNFGLSEIGRVTIPQTTTDFFTGLEWAATEAVRMARSLRADEFVIATPWADVAHVDRIEQGLRLSPLPVRLLPDSGARTLLARHGRRGDGSLRLVDLQREPLGLASRIAKRSLDLAVASLALLLLLPLLAGAALAVRLDSSGSALFRQRRNGFDRRTFTIYKFRTMSVLEDHGSIPQASRDDARVTRVGRFLRRSSIDELPQLWNVVKGDMSLVGPRPHALAHDQFYEREIGDYCVRHHVKPGITGWAQVNGLRGETRDTAHMERRVEYDLWYITNWSLLLDLRIMLRTCLEVLTHDAY